MNPHLQNILHDITMRLAKLEEVQKREWVGLTPEEVEDAIVEGNLLDDYPQEFVAILEAKLKEKNT